MQQSLWICTVLEEKNDPQEKKKFKQVQGFENKTVERFYFSAPDGGWKMFQLNYKIISLLKL